MIGLSNFVLINEIGLSNFIFINETWKIYHLGYQLEKQYLQDGILMNCT